MFSKPTIFFIPKNYTKAVLSLLLTMMGIFAFVNTTYASSNWVNQGDTNYPHGYHLASLLSDGKVLVAGGEYDTLSRRTVEIFTKNQNGIGTWTVGTPMNYDREYFTLNSFKNIRTGETNVLAVGGAAWGCSCIRNSAEVYNSSTNTWTLTPNLNYIRGLHAASVLNDGKILVTGGTAHNGFVLEKLNSTEVYDPVANTWIVKASLNTARAYHKQVTYLDAQGQSKVMVMGGIDTYGNYPPKNGLSSTEIYDQISNTWIFGPSMSSKRYNFSTVLLRDGRILVVGGNDAGDSEVYDPQTNQWSVYPTKYKAIFPGIVALGENAGYNILVSGSGTTSAMLFDPQINSWISTTSMNSSRSGFPFVLLEDGTALAVGGGATGRASEIYIPEIITPTPPQNPEAFLGIPFDYVGQGKTFEQVALNPESWFDHEYPLADVLCTKLFCPLDIIRYDSQSRNRTLDAYKHHNGYDYSSGNGAALDVPVLAAASGSAEYIKEASSGGYGNLVKITHDNVYQTWYGHLQPQKDPISGNVNKGDKIGLVGTSGNSSGPHIHFTVLKNINGDNKFDYNDIPYGFVDPLGWEGSYTDPWTEYKAGNSSGSASIKLFTNFPNPTTQIISKSGGEMNRKNLKLDISPDTLPTNFTIKIKDGPFEHIELNSKKLSSIVSSFFLEAFNTLGDKITQFLKPIKITYDYSGADLSNTKEETLKTYYYDILEQKWIPIDSIVDLDKKLIIAEIAHFTQFAVMGEVKDAQAPVTQAILSGNKGQDNWYRSDVGVELKGADNEGGLGLLYTLFSLDEDLWEEYSNELSFSNEGDYKITYQSFDKANNKEERKKTEFRIDKTAPVTSANISGTEGLKGWYVSDVSVNLIATDGRSGIAKTEYSLDDGQTYQEYSDGFNIRNEGISEVIYRSIDKAGNVEAAKEISIKIDKTPPSTIVYTTGTRGQDNWYRTDVQVAFNAHDDISGFDKTFYSNKNTENYIEYVDPLVFKDEGRNKVFYYSTDQAGNKEDEKVIEVKIDKTPPEAQIRYDLSRFDTIVAGTDNFESTFITQNNSPSHPSYMIRDNAGNTLFINIDKSKAEKQASLSVKNIQYNDTDTIYLDKNIFFTLALTDSNNMVKQLNQHYSLKNDKKIFTLYSSKTNETKIFIKSSGLDYAQETKPGIALLYLSTDKGKLKYSY